MFVFQLNWALYTNKKKETANVLMNDHASTLNKTYWSCFNKLVYYVEPMEVDDLYIFHCKFHFFAAIF